MRTKLRATVSSPLLYMLLFAAYPVIFLWAHNRGNDISATTVLGVLGIVVGATLAVFGLMFLLLRDRSRAAIATTIIVLLFETFGHVRRHCSFIPGRIDTAHTHQITRQLH